MTASRVMVGKRRMFSNNGRLSILENKTEYRVDSKNIFGLNLRFAPKNLGFFIFSGPLERTYE